MTLKTCPNCGADVPVRSKSCPDCGSCDETGWSAEAQDGLDLPDEKFDYDDFVTREFGSGSPKPRGIRWFWWVTAVVVLMFFLFLLLRH